MINVGHRPEPTDPRVGCCRSVFRAKIRQCERDIREAQTKFTWVGIVILRSNVDPMGGNTVLCNHAVGFPSGPSAAFMYMAATE